MIRSIAGYKPPGPDDVFSILTSRSLEVQVDGGRLDSLDPSLNRLFVARRPTSNLQVRLMEQSRNKPNNSPPKMLPRLTSAGRFALLLTCYVFFASTAHVLSQPVVVLYHVLWTLRCCVCFFTFRVFVFVGADAREGLRFLKIRSSGSFGFASRDIVIYLRERANQNGPIQHGFPLPSLKVQCVRCSLAFREKEIVSHRSSGCVAENQERERG